MSWVSSFFTRSKAAIEAGVSMIPIVGSVVAGAVDHIHTGDEHQDAYGNWVNNNTGTATVVQSPAVQAEIDRVNAFNASVLASARQTAADSAARIGAAATLSAAAAIGPQGNVYQKTIAFASGNPVVTIGGLLAVGLLIYVAMRKR